MLRLLVVIPEGNESFDGASATAQVEMDLNSKLSSVDIFHTMLGAWVKPLIRPTHHETSEASGLCETVTILATDQDG